MATKLLRVASKLPVGDKTRREILKKLAAETLDEDTSFDMLPKDIQTEIVAAVEDMNENSIEGALIDYRAAEDNLRRVRRDAKYILEHLDDMGLEQLYDEGHISRRNYGMIKRSLQNYRHPV